VRPFGQGVRKVAARTVRTRLAARAIEGTIGSGRVASGKGLTYRRFGLRKRAATGKREFDLLRGDLGIEHHPAPRSSPTACGMVAHFNGRFENGLPGAISVPAKSRKPRWTAVNCSTTVNSHAGVRPDRCHLAFQGI